MKIGEQLENWSFSMSILDKLRLKNGNYLFSEHTGQRIHSLLKLFNFPLDELCQKFGKNAQNV